MTVPRTILPGVTGLTVKLPTPPGMLLGLDSFRAWPSGIRFFFVLAARVSALPDEGSPVAAHGLTAEWREPGTPPPECVRFSVTHGDGTTISNLDGHGANPRGVLDLREGGGSGGCRSDWLRHDLGWWLSPLPPPGDLVFAVEWPFAGLDRTEARVDAGVLREAALHARPLSEITC
ncbi:MAG: hypothetical protein M0010_01755 [Actinomycetota bacterium]|jgi:hypothetical protein|nr:hypothetical protein [Actinomycetota bacterium]